VLDELIISSTLSSQRVLFDRCAGTEIRLDGDEHMIIRAADVLAVLE